MGRDAARGEACLGELAAEGLQACFLEADVRDRQAMDRVAEQVLPESPQCFT